MSLIWLVPVLLFIIVITPCEAQTYDSSGVPRKQLLQNDSSLFKSSKQLVSEKITVLRDTNKIKTIASQLKSRLDSLPSVFKNGKKKLQAGQGDSLKESLNSVFSFKNIIPPKPFIRFNGGIVSYNTNYRSNIDTPFIEKNIMQHNLYGSMGMSVANIPLRINYLFRRSNSAIFRDINDVQVELDVMQFGNKIRSRLKDQLLALSSVVNDSLLEFDYKTKLGEFRGLNDWMNKPGLLQKLAECKEILNVPGLTIDPKLSDSVNKEKSTAIKKEAQAFIDTYNKTKGEYDLLKKKVDSLENKYSLMRNKVQLYRSLVQDQLNGNNSIDKLADKLKEYGLANYTIPKKYRILLNVKKLAIGKNNPNYSELTSKNMSLTGLNFEYNSWYYVAVTAGTVDYRFRDFVINKSNRSPQYMYMLRLGIGKKEGTHFIVSAYKGQKQVFAVTNNSAASNSISISGLAAEGKYAINRNTYFSTEVAVSFSPDFRNASLSKTKLDLNDQSNKAMAAKFYSYLPKTGSRFEAMYKYTGANFQSFSNFQTNSSVKSWYIKADQTFLKRKLKVAVAAISNEFSNPYIIQQYKSNTVYKSIQATFRARKFPVITVGYIPTSQITAINNQLVENHFYSLNAAITHNYKLGERKANSVFVFNRFFNNESDTSYLYYNATNVFFNQAILFSLYTMNLSISHSKSNSFELNVLDAGIRVPLLKNNIIIGFGVKVNDFDKKINETGLYGSVQLNIKKLGVINMNYDDGFIPGNNHRFVRNEWMNINFTKVF